METVLKFGDDIITISDTIHVIDCSPKPVSNVKVIHAPGLFKEDKKK